MRGALKRLAKAYQNGLLDQEVFTNKTSTCREKYYSSKVGIFAYWAGNWNSKLDDKVQQRNEGTDTSVIPLPAIKESHYASRVPSNLGITVKAENPEGIFKYLIEFMHDGGEGQMLFTHGVEGVHYKKNGDTYEKLPKLSDPKNTFIKSFISPELQLTPWTDPFALDERIVNSIAVMREHAKDDTLVPPSETLAQINADLEILKDNLIAKVMVGEKSVDEALAEYKKETDKIGLSLALSEMNE
jgi:putative aldouronate transport system substrate-binding protein